MYVPLFHKINIKHNCYKSIHANIMYNIFFKGTDELYETSKYDFIKNLSTRIQDFIFFFLAFKRKFKSVQATKRCKNLMI